jgi:hypothetical protein
MVNNGSEKSIFTAESDLGSVVKISNYLVSISFSKFLITMYRKYLNP